MIILFDFDGTLFDTSRDIHEALTQLLKEHNKPEIPYSELMPLISRGSKAILEPIIGKPENYIPRLLEICIENGFQQSKPFTGIESMLAQLERDNIPWGIVTNRLESMTRPILFRHGYLERAKCLVYGDTTNQTKPHPKPLLHAAKLMGVDPKTCIYVGDAITDIEAGKAAGMRTLAAEFGFIDPQVPVASWNADKVAKKVPDILPRIKEWIAP